jgi:hypothetical protein
MRMMQELPKEEALPQAALVKQEFTSFDTAI